MDQIQSLNSAFNVHREDRNLFQIYLSDFELDIPPGLVQHQRSFQELQANMDYFLLNKETLRCFVQKHYGGDVLWAYDNLRPYAYKADLGRYCLLYSFGGLYADITLKPLLSVNPSDQTKMVYFYDHGNGSCQAVHGCQNGFIYAKKGLELMKRCIERIVINCRDKYYGPNPLAPTGPNLFGSVISNYVPDSGYHHGYFMQLTPFHAKKNRAYVGPGGEIIALHKTAWSSGAKEARLDNFGAKGVNKYTTMWLHGEVYA